MALIQGVLFLAGTLGDYTEYRMQFMIAVAMIFPGTLMLGLVGKFGIIARNQTRGVWED